MGNAKAKGAGAKRRTREDWTAEVASWRKSGLGSARYAAQRGLKRGTLLWWSCRIGPSAHVVAGERSTGATFVPLRVREESQSGPSMGSGSSSIEVVLGNGRILRIAGAVDAAELARVIAIVEGVRGC